MKVGLVAPPWLPVPPPSYGGTEMVIDFLACGLAKAGHDVRVFTTGDSDVPVPTEFVREHAAGDQIGSSIVELGHLAEAYDALADCDVVHDHTLSGPLWALAHNRPNVVTTCHGPLRDDLQRLYRAYGRWDLPVVAISHDQAAWAPDVPIARVIHHGVDPARFPSGTGDGGYLLFLGRMTADKGAHEAIQIARRTGRPLKIAAKMRDQDERNYFHARVQPLLGGDMEYLGEADNNTKLELLAGATALLNPIRWPEPFGLVMIEALACGTPVLTYRVGAAPEIIDHGVTGFLCTDRSQLQLAVDRIGELSRADCRAAVAGYFSSERMVAEHISLYEDMMR
jgi:glycosyltransferase involved in cell wall biosynthesis